MEGNVIHLSGEQNEDQNAGIRTKMLTVWRKLHIEVDSMGDATDNKVEGYLAEDRKVGTGTKTLQVMVTPALEVNRFENGRMVINGRSYPVVDMTSTQDANTTDTVTIRVTSVFNITTTTPFMLYDDDDMDDEDVGNLNGDEGDDVPEPDTSLLTDSSSPANNYLAPAYIIPKYDLPNSHENVDFVANITSSRDALDTILSNTNGNFDNFATEASTDFWTIYLLGGYQLGLADDGDPRFVNSNGVLIATFGATNVFNTVTTIPRVTDGYGAVILMEMGRSTEYPDNYLTRPVNRAYTTTHEVGHLFGCIHGEGGLMETTQDRTVGTFSDTSLSFVRKAQHP